MSNPIQSMKINEIYSLWPSIENKVVRINLGKKSITAKVISMYKSGLNVYIKTDGYGEIMSRNIKSIIS